LYRFLDVAIGLYNQKLLVPLKGGNRVVAGWGRLLVEKEPLLVEKIALYLSVRNVLESWGKSHHLPRSCGFCSIRERGGNLATLETYGCCRSRPI